MNLHDRMFHRFGRRYEKGAVICDEGGEARAVYYLLSGRVGIERCAGRTVEVLTTLGPGEFFGEMAVLMSSARTATARALEDCLIAVIDRETFQALLKSSGEVSFLIIKELAHRLKDTSDALEQAHQRNHRMQAVAFLLRERPSAPVEDVVERLAGHLGKGPGEVRDILQWLQFAGAVSITRDQILSIDERALLQAADPE